MPTYLRTYNAGRYSHIALEVSTFLHHPMQVQYDMDVLDGFDLTVSPSVVLCITLYKPIFCSMRLLQCPLQFLPFPSPNGLPEDHSLR